MTYTCQKLVHMVCHRGCSSAILPVMPGERLDPRAHSETPTVKMDYLDPVTE